MKTSRPPQASEAPVQDPPGGVERSLLVLLAKRIAEGDPRAEQQLVELYRNRLVTTVARRLGDRDLAHEIADDTLIAVVCSLRRSRVRELERLDAFVFATARNLMNNHRRSGRRRLSIHSLTQEPIGPDPFDEHVMLERERIIRDRLSRFDDLDRSILLQALFGGSSSPEIAKTLRLSESVVRQRKHRAIGRLVKLLSTE